jgi:hypothetical protein
MALLFWTILGLCLLAAAPSRYRGSYSTYDFETRRHIRMTYDQPNNDRYLFLLMPIMATPAAGLLVLGGRRMMRYRSYQLAVVASFWAMLPWSPFFVMGIPFGIWAIRLLRRPDVQAAFGLPAAPAEVPPEVPPIPSPAPEGSRTTGPVRRRVRSFFHSLYSLVFESRASGGE